MKVVRCAREIYQALLKQGPLFKTVGVQEKEYLSDFRRVPDGLALVDAADTLTKQVIAAANR